MSDPEVFLRRAIALSVENVRTGRGGPFGAVIVRNSEVIAEAVNEVTRTHDPTAHAEVCAIRSACTQLRTHHLSGCEIYSSCEPCPMCLAAIYWAHLDRLTFAATAADAAAVTFDDGLIYRELQQPWNQRRLPTRQMLREEALAAFHEWRHNPAKIPY